MNFKPYAPAIYEVKPSKIVPGQSGLFALVDFSKDQVIIPNSNWDESRFISWEEFESLDPATKKKLIDFCYKTEKGIDAPQNINNLNIGYFMNHSCDPCVYPVSNGDYLAKKDIKAGDEFTIDLEKLMEKPTFSFECSCGSRNCRKIVKG